MKSLLDAYRRWRHGRGYGVHSPWAYRIITEALRGEYAYYDDSKIDALFGNDARVARQVYRVLALENCRVLAITVIDRRWTKLALMASPSGTRPTLLAIGDNIADTIPEGIERVVIASKNTDRWIAKISSQYPRCLAVTNGKTLTVANLTGAANHQIIKAKY